MYLTEMKETENLTKCSEINECDAVKFYKERLEYLEGLVRKYKFDFLTGLMGKRDYIDKLDRLFEEYKFADQKFVFGLVDIDSLHNINREHGYHYGDQVITSIAEQLREIFQFYQVYRISGDEFALLIREEHTDLEVLENKLSKIEGVSYVLESVEGYDSPKRLFKTTDAKLSAKKLTRTRI